MIVSNVYYSIDSQGIHPEVEGNVLDAAIAYCLEGESSPLKTSRTSTVFVIVPAAQVAEYRKVFEIKLQRLLAQNNFDQRNPIVLMLRRERSLFNGSRYRKIAVLGDQHGALSTLVEKCFVSSDCVMPEEVVTSLLVMMPPKNMWDQIPEYSRFDGY